MQLGAGALALLLLLWLLGRRRKSGTGDDAGVSGKRSKKTTLKAGMDPPVDQVLGGDFGAMGGAGTAVSGKRFAADADTDDLLDVNQDSPWGDAFEPAKADVKHSYAEANHASSEEQHEEDDLLTEANVYIAYGLYQQAESELKKGIERHPERLEYRHKLLECYFVANNREAFDRQAEQFVTLEGRNKEALWKGIIEWGRKISPDNVLYQNANSLGDGVAVAGGVGAVAAAALATAAFAEAAPVPRNTIADNLKSDEELFFDEPQYREVKPVPVPSFADEALPSSVTEPNDLDDLDLGELDFDDIDLDKLLQGDERPSTAPQAIADMPAAKVVAAQADYDDLALPDLDLDLDFDQSFNLDSAARTMPEPSGAVSDADNLLDFLTDGLDEPSAPVASSAVPLSAAAPATNLNLHLDNSGLNRILPKDTFYAPPATADATGKDEDWLGDIDDALSFLDFPDDEIDLHEAHISTKLDLARAYLDMGDIEGARSTLEEVMVEGNDDQRREAEVLLHQTG
jgi:pilus assembly protein FimV